jgi:hypothetical protein
MHRILLAVLVVALWAAPRAGAAVDVADGKLSVNGYGSWAYARTAAHNLYGDATPEGNYDLAMFDLALSARPTPDVFVHAQLGFDRDEVSAEWVFGEWRAIDAFRLRAGKICQPLGNFAETRFTGTLRPFFDLPKAIYGAGEIGATSFLGVGATGDVPFDSGWGLAYDLYGGEVRVPAFEPYDALRPGADVSAALTDVQDKRLRNLVGLRFSVTTPFDLVVRVSGYGGQVDDDANGRVAYHVEGVSALYRGERLWLSAELFTAEEMHHERTVAAYAEVAWFVTPHWQVAARAEAARVTLYGDTVAIPDGDQLTRHAEAALGVSYWLSPSMVLKASVHETRGNRFAVPAAGIDAGLRDRTLSFVSGAQFSF